MKKLLNIVVTLCALAGAVVFWMLGGAQWLKMQAGPEELGAEEEFGRAEGRYVSYEAAYPVASRAEEYYSGDPDRVRTTGYIVYDAKRQAFVYVVVSERNDKGFGSLMWNLHLTVEMRAGKDMTPITVEGSLEAMDPDAVKEAVAALEDSEIVELYTDFQDSAGYYEAYFNDEYGKVMETMCKSLEEGLQQTDWYYIECGSINGLSAGDIWICILAAGLNLLIFVFRLIALFTGGRKASGGRASDSGSKLGQFFDAQREWVEEWCDYSMNRGRRLGYLSVIGGAVIFLAIGFFAKASMQKMLVFYLSLGVLLGEVTGLLFWLGQKSQSKPDKILQKLEKSVKKQLSSPAEQEDFAQDILNTGKEWAFREKTKDSMQQGVVGSRYWVSLSWNGLATIIDSERLDKIETATISGQVRSGKVRIRYVSYAARFYYRNADPKKTCDKALSFQSEDAIGFFMVLVRKRVGDNIKITAEQE